MTEAATEGRPKTGTKGPAGLSEQLVRTVEAGRPQPTATGPLLRPAAAKLERTPTPSEFWGAPQPAAAAGTEPPPAGPQPRGD